MTNMHPFRSIGAAALLLGAVACAPAAAPSEDAQAGARAVILNAPFPDRVPGAAEGLEERLTGQDTGVAFTGAALGRFLESRRGLVAGGAETGAAGVARTVDADLALGISARTLERELVGRGSRPVERVTLQLEVFVVTAEGEPWARLSSRRYRDRERLDERELPPLNDDPVVARLRDDALEELAPLVARELRAAAERVGPEGAAGVTRSNDE